MSNVLITGANRGIGLGFVRHYLARGDQVWAGYRDNAHSLNSLNSANCHPIQWDVSEPLAKAEQAKLPEEIHLLINNAGIYGSNKGGQQLANIRQDELLEVFKIDAITPINVVQTLLARLQKGQATIANMSSKMGSVEDNTSGGAYAYRAAKSALCNISKSMAIDLQNDNINVITLHPGWVQTDMTGQTGLIDVETSVAGLAAVIDNIQQYPPGAFIAYDGATIPY